MSITKGYISKDAMLTDEKIKEYCAWFETQPEYKEWGRANRESIDIWDKIFSVENKDGVLDD